MLRLTVWICAASMVLVSCTGGDDRVDTRTTVAGTRSSDTPVALAEGSEAPSARMQAGTDSVAGVLTRLCTADDCDSTEANPGRPLELADDRLLLFTVSAVPDQARVEVRRAGRDDPAQRDTLQPGTLMGLRMSVPRGRYELRLIARFDDRRVVWGFALAVPDGPGR